MHTRRICQDLFQFWTALIVGGLVTSAASQGLITFDNVGNNNLTWSATTGGRVFIGFPVFCGPWTLQNQDINYELLAGYDAAHLTPVATWLISDGSAHGIALGDGVFVDPSGRSYRVPWAATPPPATMLDIFAWDGTADNPLLAATMGDHVGHTGPFLNPVGGIGSPPSVPADLTGMPALLIGVPEPSSLPLAVAGGVAVLALRRRISW